MLTLIGEHEDVATVLTAGRSARRVSRTVMWVVGILLVVAAAAAVLILRSRSEAAKPQYVTTPVVRGDLTVTVSATGNLQPTTQVDIGSELSGTIESVFVEQNDRVTKGQVLARLDVSKLEDQVRRGRAGLTAAEAKVSQTNATAEEARANLARMRRAVTLSGDSIYSQQQLEAAEATSKRARADVASATAAVEEARAALESDRTNVAKASVVSPIDGIVLARQIEPGQTVAASLQAPVLFTIAQNLEQMELKVDVDEAEVGQVRAGQQATFMVDAWPERTYRATVRRVDLGAQTKEGVVSYQTVLTFENADLSLRPGMTATAEIITTQRSDVLLVPNAALRFTPVETEQSRGLVGVLMPRMPGRTSSKDRESRIWVLRDATAVALAVTPGATNGQLVEVAGAGLQAGMPVITDVSTASP